MLRLLLEPEFSRKADSKLAAKPITAMVSIKLPLIGSGLLIRLSASIIRKTQIKAKAIEFKNAAIISARL